jgi:Cu+-exporting ATPase
MTVVYLQVSLEKKAGYISYNPSVTNPQVLCSAIEDMGFDAFLPPSSDTVTCKLHVDGMTSNSCVESIESVISEKSGVKNVKVDLEKKEAVVTFCPSVLMASQVAESICDMGFNASIKEEDRIQENGGMYSTQFTFLIIKMVALLTIGRSA